MSEDGFRLLETRVGFSASERWRRRARVVMIGSLVGSLLCAVLGFALTSAFSWGMLVGLVVAGGAAIVAGNPSRRRGDSSPGSLSIEGETIVVRAEREGERSFQLSEVAEGWLEAPGRVVLRLQDGFDVAVDVPDDETGHRMLEAAGVAASARVMRVALASAASRVPWGEILGVTGMLFTTPLTVLFVAVLLASSFEGGPMNPIVLFAFVLLPSMGLFGLVAALFRFMRSREVVVGTDGVVFHGYFGPRFIPYTEIENVRRHSHGVLLGLRRNEKFLLPVRAAVLSSMPLTPPPRVARTAAAVLDENLVRREILFRRIEEARAARGQSSVVRLDLEKLDQRDKPFSVWLDEMRRLLAERGGYRESRIVPEDLAVVVEDPGAAPERRIGAAIALSQSNDEGTKRRIRIAVEACADLELRAALEEAAHGEIIQARVEKLRHRFRD
ncbi:hypothetical protein [Polyangium sorediatum]|uniref:Band 7 domain-containing protein n=1 Tax=Polyangium sorediatum TaxID=889274 RepID=A0ABT6NUV0_9BACT|nr:hypothetical protein [Polyangium sorediatum]MDI1432061.1 hypothetical protein [Polyangium sorediatum]